MSWCLCQRLLNCSKRYNLLFFQGGQAIGRQQTIDAFAQFDAGKSQLNKYESLNVGKYFSTSSCQKSPDESQRKDSNEENSSEEKKKPKSSALVKQDFFDRLDDKSKETFLAAIDVFIDRDVHARGHVEFIYAALRHMKDFGVHRDLDAYKKLIDIFPKGKFIPTNLFQVEFMHYPKQQQCGIDLLEQMETLGVIPDSVVEDMLINVFGNFGFPLRKVRRMLYWMPKFKNLTPWPIPDPLPEDGLTIAKLAIQRITSVDVTTKISVYYPLEELDDSIDPTWIVSGQSPDQQRLIEEHPADRPIYVEGAFRIWLRRACINYFILRSEPKPTVVSDKDVNDVGFLRNIFSEDYIEKDVAIIPSVHEQADGVILGVCASGTSSHDSLLSWIRFLERTNPRLGKDISILFTLKSPIGPTDDLIPITDTPTDGLITPGVAAVEQLKSAVEMSNKISEKSQDSPTPKKLTLDPVNPELSQIGIDETSDSKFINWPHHYNTKARSKFSADTQDSDRTRDKNENR